MLRVAVLLCLVACKGDLGDSCKYSFDCKSHECVDHVCESGLAGAKCNQDIDCKYEQKFGCFEHVCRLPGRMGDACADDDDCEPDLACSARHCIAKETATAEREAKAKKDKAEKEARLLEQSGVAPEPQPKVEQVTAPPGAGSRVRVVTTTAADSAFAACRSDERLVGGSCASTSKNGAVTSYPSGYGDQDTVGARWNCALDGSQVTVYALCAKLP